MTKIPTILESGRADGKLVTSGAIFDENKGMFQSEINDIQDTLNSDNSNKPLSAKQGKVLKELLDAKVIEAGAVPIDSEPIEGNTTHVVNSDGLAKEFNKCNTAIITTDRIGNGAVTSEKIATSAFDSTLSVSGKIAPADVVGGKLTKLGDRTDNIHNDVYGIEGITFEFKDFEDNYFYNTSIQSVSLKAANTSFANLVINCEPKEEFNIKGIGGATARLWAFVKSDGSIISNAEANAGNINEGVTIVAPLETDKLYIQINKNTTPSYSTSVKVSTKSAEGVLKRLERCEQTTIEVESISKDVEDNKGKVKFIESVLPSKNKVYTFTDFEDGVFWSTYSSVAIRGENTSFASIVIDCKPSDKFTIIGIGGASGRLWAFANGTTIITRSEASTGNYEEGTTVIAPEGANTLYVNISKTSAVFDANKTKIYNDDKIIIPINEFVNAKINEIRKEFGRKASFKLLAVGNSFTLNALNYLAWVMDSVAPDVDYTIGYAIHGGSSLEMHYNYLIGDEAQEAYFKIKKGDNALTLVKPTTSGKWSDFIDDEDWDMITFQQASGLSGDYTTFQPYLNDIIKRIYSMIRHNIKVGWLIVPSKMTDLQESITNYNTISDASQQVISKTIATFVLPCGTAIQNLRTTSLQSLGYNLCTDPSNPNISGHLCSGLPWITETYAAAMTILKMLGREDISVYGDKLRPTQDWANGKELPYTSGEIIHPNVGITDDNCRIAQICAIQAVKNPYEITDCSGLE